MFGNNHFLLERKCNCKTLAQQKVIPTIIVRDRVGLISQECLSVSLPLALDLVKPSELTRDSYTSFS